MKDSIRVFSEMYDAIVLRAQREEAYVREVADIATIPVINACCEGAHPTQMLADALTMQELLGNLMFEAPSDGTVAHIVITADMVAGVGDAMIMRDPMKQPTRLQMRLPGAPAPKRRRGAVS